MIEKLSFAEKFGYGLGDMAANFVFQAMLALQLDFYTHTFGLTAAQAGTMLLVVGPRCGLPQSGHGRDRRPHQHEMGQVPALAAVDRVALRRSSACSPSPRPISARAAKIIYAWVTYILLRVIYTVNNVPYASLTAVMTSDPDERNSISSYRQIAANSAGFIVASLAIPMVRVLRPRQRRARLPVHHGPAVGAERHLLHRRLLLHQRAHPARSAAEDLARPGSCRPFQEPSWVVLFLATLFYFTAIVIRGNVMLPYFRLCRRQRRPLLLVQRLRPGLAARRRCLLHGCRQARGQAPALYCQHGVVRRLQRGAALSFRRTPPSRSLRLKCCASSRSDCRAASSGR